MVNQCSSASVHLFGGPFVTVQGRRLPVPEGSKRVLAFVALRYCSVDRRHLARVLWPSGSESRAAGNLRSALWRLNTASIGVVRADSCALSLAEGVSVDVQDVGAWAGRLISGRARDEDLMIPRSPMEALDLLPGWYEEWVVMEREWLRQRTLHALESLCQLLVRHRRFAEAVEAGMLAVNGDPLRESAQRVLVGAHLAEGNVVEARRRYEAYRRLVRRELDVEPSSEFARLVNPRAPLPRTAPAARPRALTGS